MDASPAYSQGGSLRADGGADAALAQVDPDSGRDGDGFPKADAHDALLILLPLRGRCSRLSAESSKVRFLCRIRPPKHGNEVYASSSSGSKSR
ncbi:hypothetical protein SDC9_52161 [bioreactor metagenome]|uniref:Uncharacterized protein n=1 Tax=bioreactor metagenome TaxID=1076179 RepID=A0A644WPN7_9ZZZZ